MKPAGHRLLTCSFLPRCETSVPVTVVGVLSQREVLQNKAVYFTRISNRGVGEASCEEDIAIGEVPVGALEAFRALLADLYLPVLSEQGQWGASTEAQTQAFLKACLPGCLTCSDLASPEHATVIPHMHAVRPCIILTCMVYICLSAC